MNRHYDLFVIGAGSGGVRAARVAATLGARVAIAESKYLGGTCVNVGCVPKKLMVYASHFNEDFGDAKGFGWHCPQAPVFNWQTLIENKNKEIARLNQVYANLLQNAGVDLLEGRARFMDAHTVCVDGEHYSAARILIATGSRAYIPDFPGSEYTITSDDVFYLPQLPQRLLVVGAGYIAIEFAGIFAALGTATTVLVRSNTILRHFDQDIQAHIKQEICKKGIKLNFSETISHIEKNLKGELEVNLSSGARVTVDCVLNATGRLPLVQGLDLDKTQVNFTETHGIKINEHYQTSEPSIYAIGDVINRVQLTPVALAEGMYVANHLFGQAKPAAIDYRTIATAVFCQPNIGTIGLTEQQAREQYQDIKIFHSSFSHLKHTLSGRDEKTLMKIIVDSHSDKVVGMHMVGMEAGEIIQGFAAAITAGITKTQLDATIGVHPTAAEEFVTMRVPSK